MPMAKLTVNLWYKDYSFYKILGSYLPRESLYVIVEARCKRSIAIHFWDSRCLGCMVKRFPLRHIKRKNNGAKWFSSMTISIWPRGNWEEAHTTREGPVCV